MTPLAKAENQEELTIPTLDEGTITYEQVDDEAFDAMIAQAYVHICQRRGEGIRLSIEDLASCEYAREVLVERFEAHEIAYTIHTRGDGVWRICCVETGSVVEIRLDVMPLCLPRN